MRGEYKSVVTWEEFHGGECLLIHGAVLNSFDSVTVLIVTVRSNISLDAMRKGYPLLPYVPQLPKLPKQDLNAHAYNLLLPTCKS